MCKMLGDLRGNQHSTCVPYYYGQCMICLHMGRLQVMQQRGIKVALVMHEGQFQED
jgi:hypothetical protein